MPTSSPTAPLNVVVVGGGVAALETVLALRATVGDAAVTTLIAPEPAFELRALSLAAPFGRGEAARLPLRTFMAEHEGSFLRAAVVGVDHEARQVECADGLRVPYDVLVLALGAVTVPTSLGAFTIGQDPRNLGGIVEDLRAGRARSAAFVVPRGCSWPLPLYEIALMTAEALAPRRFVRPALHLLTSEIRPLAVLGTQASLVTAELLDAAGITLHRGVAVRVRPGGRIDTGFDPQLCVDRVIALPTTEGPRLQGLPATARGFVPVTDHGLVDGLPGVYAVGDMTDRSVKQGGLACQQADAAVSHIAAALGLLPEPRPLTQVLRGRLLTGRRDRFLQRVGPRDIGMASDEPLWWPPAKVQGEFLTPYLESKGLVRLPLDVHPFGPGLDVDVEASDLQAV